MSKAEEFQAISAEFRAMLVAQAFLKDEVIQNMTERVMLFVVENMDLIARALRRDEYIESPPILLAPESKAQLAALREAVR